MDIAALCHYGGAPPPLPLPVIPIEAAVKVHKDESYMRMPLSYKAIPYFISVKQIKSLDYCPHQNRKRSKSLSLKISLSPPNRMGLPLTASIGIHVLHKTPNQRYRSDRNRSHVAFVVFVILTAAISLSVIPTGALWRENSLEDSIALLGI